MENEQQFYIDIANNVSENLRSLRKNSLWKMSNMTFHLSIFENIIDSQKDMIDNTLQLASQTIPITEELEKIFLTMQAEFHKTVGLFQRRIQEFLQTDQYQLLNNTEKGITLQIQEQANNVALSKEEWNALKEEDPIFQNDVNTLVEMGIPLEKAKEVVMKNSPGIPTGFSVECMLNMEKNISEDVKTK